MRRKLIILTILLLLLGAKPVSAAAPIISNIPSAINIDTGFSINASMSGLSNNTIYRLRLVLATPGTSSYFGSTFNSSNWYNGTPSPINYSNFLSITTDNSGSWSGSIEGKIESSDPNLPASSGTYDLKVGRYTETGSSATWSNIIQITLVTPTPTPSPTPSSTPSPTSTPTPPTATPTTLTSQFTISDLPSQINPDQSFTVKINLSLPSNLNTPYYLKGAFKIKDGTRYFGLTKNGNDWIEYGDDALDQYKITTDSSGNWSGNLEVKPDTFDKDYKGAGDYIFKVARLTSANSSTWSNESNIKISANPTPQPTTQTTPSPAKSATPKPTILSTPSPSQTPELSSEEEKTATVAGVEIENVKLKGTINLFSFAGIAMIVAGVSILSYIFIKNSKLINLWKK